MLSVKSFLMTFDLTFTVVLAPSPLSEKLTARSTHPPLGTVVPRLWSWFAPRTSTLMVEIDAMSSVCAAADAYIWRPHPK